MKKTLIYMISITFLMFLPLPLFAKTSQKQMCSDARKYFRISSEKVERIQFQAIQILDHLEKLKKKHPNHHVKVQMKEDHLRSLLGVVLSRSFFALVVLQCQHPHLKFKVVRLPRMGSRFSSLIAPPQGGKIVISYSKKYKKDLSLLRKELLRFGFSSEIKEVK